MLDVYAGLPGPSRKRRRVGGEAGLVGDRERQTGSRSGRNHHVGSGPLPTESGRPDRNAPEAMTSGAPGRPTPIEADANVWSEYEIEPQGSLVDRPLRNLKHGDAFAVLDSFGDIGATPDTPEGLFYRDTRFLSRFELRIEGKRPLLLGSAVA